MKFLRVTYFFYLSLLPTLAMGSLGQNMDGGISWWWLPLFLGVVVYLDLVAEVIPYPTTLPAALGTTLAVPLQVFLALQNSENIWLIFSYQFLIEVVGALTALMYYGLFKHGYGGAADGKAIGRMLVKKVAVVIPLLLLPVGAIIYVLGPLFGEIVFGWTTLFLVSAAVSSFFSYSARLHHGPIRSDEYSGFIIFGTMAFIFLGPFLFHWLG